MPRILVIAGPNGAGKTTLASELLANVGQHQQFVNADLIGAGISPLDPDTADVAAGRAMLRRIQELVDEGSDFALETTLSGSWIEKSIPEWQSAGYFVELVYVRLDSAELSIERVAARVRKGGHSIPVESLRRRFARSLDRFAGCKTLVDKWIEYNNSGDSPELVDCGRKA